MTGAPRDLFLSLEQVKAMGLPNPLSPAQERPERSDGPTACAACGAIKPTRPHGITYVASREGYVKIGRTAGTHSVPRRLGQLRRRGAVLCPEGMDETIPLELRFVLDDPEHDVHERMAEFHVIGEWFRADPVLAALGAR